MKPTDKTPKNSLGKPQDYPRLLSEIKERIRSAQYEALKAVNKELVGLYWDIGRLIVERQEAQGWGKAVVEQLAADLRTEFPGVGGFSASNLWRMKAFFEAYTGLEKLAQLVREIGWSHNLALLEPCKDTCRHRRTSPFCWRTCEPDGHQRKGTGTDHHLFPRGGGRSVQCDAQDRP